jgi:hypothetical protein
MNAVRNSTPCCRPSHGVDREFDGLGRGVCVGPVGGYSLSLSDLKAQWLAYRRHCGE